MNNLWDIVKSLEWDGCRILINSGLRNSKVWRIQYKCSLIIDYWYEIIYILRYILKSLSSIIFKIRKFDKICLMIYIYSNVPNNALIILSLLCTKWFSELLIFYKFRVVNWRFYTFERINEVLLCDSIYLNLIGILKIQPTVALSHFSLSACCPFTIFQLPKLFGLLEEPQWFIGCISYKDK